jgi:predicted naringenin-chalcone synthase
MRVCLQVLSNSGTGERTAWPPGIVQCKDPKVRQDWSMQATREEASSVIFQCLEKLFAETGLQPKEIDFLVINCSLFSPTPSLAAMCCNRFKFRHNCRTFNLSGQGCSASLLSVDLANELLRSNPNTNAIVVSTESITQSLYHGHEKGFLLQNTLFRCGGAAVLLTNKPRLVWKAKYRLRNLVRTQCADDEAYQAVYECEEPNGIASGRSTSASGVRLSKEIVKVAGNAMKINLTQLGPLVLPLSEQLYVLISMLRQRLSGGKTRRYIPSFKSCIHHFCIHAGGRAVLDGIEKNLRLTPEDMAHSRSCLHDYGNTSSSSIWYELRHIEQHSELRRGHKILQLAFGSGFKCNSAVWTRL